MCCPNMLINNLEKGVNKEVRKFTNEIRNYSGWQNQGPVVKSFRETVLNRWLHHNMTDEIQWEISDNVSRKKQILTDSSEQSLLL